MSLEFTPSASPISWNNCKSVCVRACVYGVHANWPVICPLIYCKKFIPSKVSGKLVGKEKRLVNLHSLITILLQLSL